MGGCCVVRGACRQGDGVSHQHRMLCVGRGARGENVQSSNIVAGRDPILGGICVSTTLMKQIGNRRFGLQLSYKSESACHKLVITITITAAT